MHQLPVDLLKPLPIIPDWFFPTLKAIGWSLLAMVVLTIAIYLYLRYRKKIPEYVPKYREDMEYAQNHYREVYDTINRIKMKYLKNQSFRDGLHDLSASLKTYLERATGMEIEEMTSEEIGSSLDNKGITEFFYRMSLLQFGRVAPGEKEFLSAINHSRRTIKNFKARLKRRGVDV